MASCSLVKVQIVRGVIGTIALVAAYFLFQPYPFLSFAFIALSAFAMKGCPACWIVEMTAAVFKSRDERKKTKAP